MCFERTRKKVEPFHIGYKVMRKMGEKYYPAYAGRKMMGWFSSANEEIPIDEWVDEMPWRDRNLLLEESPKGDVGWHVLTHISQVERFMSAHMHSYTATVFRVECYGLDEPYGLGRVFDKPAGRFQFMKILEEVT